MSNQGTLVISLDLELHWGMLDVMSLDAYGEAIRAVPAAVERMLGLFVASGVHATWATVGLLMARNREEALELAPSLRPTYEDRSLDPYALLASDAVQHHPECYFAPDVVRRIADSTGQEVGTHTFSHYYCLAAGQTEAQFASDIASAKEAASRLGVSLESIVFPRNQYSPAYVRTCGEHGLRALRGNPRSVLFGGEPSDPSQLARRFGRLLDAHLPVVRFEHVDAHPTALAPGISDVPGSRFLRVGLPRPSQVLARRRVLAEMRRAAQTGRHYHLWWHPHNLGAAPESGFAELEAVLRHYVYLRDRYGMHSLTMTEAADREAS